MFPSQLPSTVPHSHSRRPSFPSTNGAACHHPSSTAYRNCENGQSSSREPEFSYSRRSSLSGTQCFDSRSEPAVDVASQGRLPHHIPPSAPVHLPELQPPPLYASAAPPSRGHRRQHSLAFIQSLIMIPPTDRVPQHRGHAKKVSFHEQTNFRDCRGCGKEVIHYGDCEMRQTCHCHACWGHWTPPKVTTMEEMEAFLESYDDEQEPPSPPPVPQPLNPQPYLLSSGPQYQSQAHLLRYR